MHGYKHLGAQLEQVRVDILRDPEVTEVDLDPLLRRPYRLGCGRTVSGHTQNQGQRVKRTITKP